MTPKTSSGDMAPPSFAAVHCNRSRSALSAAETNPKSHDTRTTRIYTHTHTHLVDTRLEVRDDQAQILVLQRQRAVGRVLVHQITHGRYRARLANQLIVEEIVVIAAGQKRVAKSDEPKGKFRKTSTLAAAAYECASHIEDGGDELAQFDYFRLAHPLVARHEPQQTKHLLPQLVPLVPRL